MVINGHAFEKYHLYTKLPIKRIWILVENHTKESDFIQSMFKI